MMTLFNFASYAGIDREMDRLDLEKLERLKQEAEIDRTETCYAGEGRIGSKHLSPAPEDSERLRRQTYL